MFLYTALEIIGKSHNALVLCYGHRQKTDDVHRTRSLKLTPKTQKYKTQPLDGQKHFKSDKRSSAVS